MFCNALYAFFSELLFLNMTLAGKVYAKYIARPIKFLLLNNNPSVQKWYNRNIQSTFAEKQHRGTKHTIYKTDEHG